MEYKLITPSSTNVADAHWDSVPAIEVLRNSLKEFLSFEIAEKRRKIIKEWALRNYKPKHTPEQYLEFMNRHECTFTVNHPQETNFTYYYSMFSVISQSVQGDTVQECLDQAFFFEALGGKPVTLYYTDEKVMYEHKAFFKKASSDFERAVLWGVDKTNERIECTEEKHVPGCACKR